MRLSILYNGQSLLNGSNFYTFNKNRGQLVKSMDTVTLQACEVCVAVYCDGLSHNQQWLMLVYCLSVTDKTTILSPLIGQRTEL